MNILLIILIVLVLLSFGGFGYGRYVDAPYANPMGALGAILLIGLIIWLLFGGAVWVSGPTTPAPLP